MGVWCQCLVVPKHDRPFLLAANLIRRSSNDKSRQSPGHRVSILSQARHVDWQYWHIRAAVSMENPFVIVPGRLVKVVTRPPSKGVKGTQYQCQVGNREFDGITGTYPTVVLIN
jgi:hypothetical protein